ncbi:MAG: ATP-binding protein [bacterium]|nr:ATP-binding protein [bacterium]
MLLNSTYGLIVYSRNRGDKTNFFFFILTISISMWGLSMLGYRGFSDDDVVLFMSRLLYFSAIMIPTAFVYFVLVFPNQNIKISAYQKYLTPIPLIVLCVLALYPGGFIHDVIVRSNEEPFIIFNQLTHILFGLYVVSYFSWAYWIVYKKYLVANNILKIQLGYIFIGTFVSTVITLITNLGLLYFGNFALNWVGQVGIIFMITLIFYSILKFHLFNIKVIATELFVFILWVFIFVKFFLSNNLQDQIVNAVLLLLLIIIGTFLIKSVIKEVNQREKIEKLAADLQTANDRLLELDKQKSEFVSFATHQLRAPLTAMKGYASLILEGDLGKLSTVIRDAITRIYDSSKTLTNIVDDYLNISRIELGSMKYSFEPVDLKELVGDVIAELKPNIEKSGLALSFSADKDKKYIVQADRDKFKQIISNIIDNSVKYTPSGSVAISLDKKDKKIIFSVKDTGIGIATAVMSKLFAKFSRADNANKQNIHGTGLGLFVAKEIVLAHNGKIWAESDGEGRGSAFFVEWEEAL